MIELLKAAFVEERRDKYPKTAAAFVRAIRARQLLADTDSAAVRAAIARYDNLGP